MTKGTFQMNSHLFPTSPHGNKCSPNPKHRSICILQLKTGAHRPGKSLGTIHSQKDHPTHRDQEYGQEDHDAHEQGEREWQDHVEEAERDQKESLQSDDLPSVLVHLEP